MESFTVTKSTPLERKSSRATTKWRTDLAKRSKRNTPTTSTPPRWTCAMSLSSSGLQSFEPDWPMSTYSPTITHPRWAAS